ncbi:Chagasin family peptidase inhibitor I42-domain-containing protein [Chytriomyces sp. MP71]|nr:Chagasin family peptidase inhibitor I42-domain-containing protein [Chytriomyces sp. MP71]
MTATFAVPSEAVAAGSASFAVSRGTAECAIHFAGNRTTGYDWELVLPAPLGIELIKDDYETNSHPEGMVGVPGVRSFVFKVNGDIGMVLPLLFQYKRSWESEPINKVTVSISFS